MKSSELRDFDFSSSVIPNREVAGSIPWMLRDFFGIKIIANTLTFSHIVWKSQGLNVEVVLVSNNVPFINQWGSLGVLRTVWFVRVPPKGVFLAVGAARTNKVENHCPSF